MTTQPPVKRILLTGAAGNVGRVLRPLLAARYDHLVSTDIAEIGDSRANETCLRGDITDPAFLANAVSQVDGVVHLAALVGPRYSYDEHAGPSFAGTACLFEACRLAGVRRIVYASSHHAVGFYQRGTLLDEHSPPRPDGWYGVSKVFGEAVGALYADKFGFRVLSIRIGSVGEDVKQERRLHILLTPRDLAQLITIGLSDAVEGHQIVYGVSRTDGAFFDNRNAFRLGYQPQDTAADLVDAEALARSPHNPDSVEGRHIGGPFAAADHPDA